MSKNQGLSTLRKKGMSAIEDDVFRQALINAGIRTTEKLLKIAGHYNDRVFLARSLHVPQSMVLDAVTTCDLFRINRLGRKMAILMKDAGVRTVMELRYRNADELHASLRAVNSRRRLMKDMPSRHEVVQYIAHANTLPPAITNRRSHIRPDDGAVTSRRVNQVPSHDRQNSIEHPMPKSEIQKS